MAPAAAAPTHPKSCSGYTDLLGCIFIEDRERGSMFGASAESGIGVRRPMQLGGYASAHRPSATHECVPAPLAHHRAQGAGRQPHPLAAVGSRRLRFGIFTVHPTLFPSHQCACRALLRAVSEQRERDLRKLDAVDGGTKPHGIGLCRRCEEVGEAAQHHGTRTLVAAHACRPVDLLLLLCQLQFLLLLLLLHTCWPNRDAPNARGRGVGVTARARA